MSNIEAIPKTVFSMVIPEVEVKLRQMQDVKSIVLFGIEVNYSNAGSELAINNCVKLWYTFVCSSYQFSTLV